MGDGGEAGSDETAGDLDPAWDALTVQAVAADRRIGLVWLGMLGLNNAAPPDVLIRLLRVGEAECLYRRDLPPEVVAAAIEIPHEDVQSMVRLRGFLRPKAQNPPDGGLPQTPPTPPTPEQIAELAAAVPAIEPGEQTTTLDWIVALHGDAAAMRQLATSPSLWVRRSVARAPRLPADVVELLARDPDRVVRLFLAESNADAPADMLLDLWSWWSGSLSSPGIPRRHPNFPREGLLRFADHPDPHWRLLALDDPASDATLAESFAGSESAELRIAAAEDPRLAPSTVVRLLDDPHEAVRYRAHIHPALPPEHLVKLLLDPRTAESCAICNPSIPAPAMHRMITLALSAKELRRPR